MPAGTPPDGIRMIAQAMRDIKVLKQRLRFLLPGPWVPLSLATGFTATAGAYPPSYRIVGDEVELCGSISGVFTGGTSITPLTASVVAMAPANNTFDSGSASAPTASCRVVVTASGQLQIYCITTASFIGLDGVRYRLT